jgi:cytidylate kinase
MIVAIDGPAGAGKSSVARLLARRLGFRYLDTGAMYRALAWLAIDRNVALDDEPAITALARESPVSFGEDSSVQVTERDVTAAIREPRIDAAVPIVARYPGVREVMRERQRALGHDGDVVIEGRDIGVVVAPEAAVKVWLVADEAVRARRRQQERAEADAEQLATALRDRDAVDAANTHRAADAVEIDTTDLGLAEVVDRIAALVEAHR